MFPFKLFQNVTQWMTLAITVVQQRCAKMFTFFAHECLGFFQKLDFCQILTTGKEPNFAACVAPPKSITGVCPQAKFKVSVKIYDNKRLARKTAYIYSI